MTSNELVVSQSNQIAKPDTFAPRNLEEAMKFADLIKQSGMAPKSYADKSAAAIVVALQFGMELGMQPLQSLQNIAHINGQPSIWGDAALALVLSSGLCEYYQEDDFETIKKNQKATFIIKRRGFPKEKVTTFSYEDAKTAGIFSNAVWKTYPYRMCQMRARSFGLRDSFPDVLKGMILAEEAQDYPGQIIDATPATTATVTATTQAAEEPTVGTEGGTAFFKAYKAHGWTTEEAKKWLADNLQIGAPHNDKDSRAIPKSKFTQAMEWANSKSPLYDEATALFDTLGFTGQEALAFVNQHKSDYAKIVSELKAELDRRDAQEQ